MAFTVATSPYLGDADSYVSLDAVDSYFDAMKDAEWLALIDDDDKRTWLLRVASTVINQRYLWINPTSYTTVPRALAIATFELAKHLSKSAAVAGSQVIKSVQVGAISIEYAVTAASEVTQDQTYTFIDMLLSGIGQVKIAAAGDVDMGWSVISVARA